MLGLKCPFKNCRALGVASFGDPLGPVSNTRATGQSYKIFSGCNWSKWKLKQDFDVRFQALLPNEFTTKNGQFCQFDKSLGSFRLAVNLLQPATVAVHCSKNRKFSNYLQQPSPLRQLLRPVTSVNQALGSLYCCLKSKRAKLRK